MSNRLTWSFLDFCGTNYMAKSREPIGDSCCHVNCNIVCRCEQQELEFTPTKTRNPTLQAIQENPRIITLTSTTEALQTTARGQQVGRMARIQFSQHRRAGRQPWPSLLPLFCDCFYPVLALSHSEPLVASLAMERTWNWNAPIASRDTTVYSKVRMF